MTTSQLTEEERQRVLEILSFGAGPESLETLIDVLLLPNHGNGDARAKAARRTRLYKVRQILKRSPSSEDVMAAGGYMLLDALTKAHLQEALQARLLDLLDHAGFARAESEAVLARLTQDVQERQEAWKTRIRQRRSKRLAAAIAETKK